MHSDKHDPGVEALGLMKAAGEQGYDVSRTKLARWHRLGLIPQPLRQFHGRGKGSTSLYPTVAMQQVLALCEAQKHHKPMEKIGWQLWWNGYEVLERYWCDPLHDAARRWDAHVAVVRDLSDEEFPDVVEIETDVLDRLLTNEDVNSLFKRLRKRLQSSDLERFLRIAMRVVAGQFTDFETGSDENPDTEAKLVERAFGFHHVQDAVEDTIKSLLQMLSRQLATPVVDVLTLTPHVDMISGRNELRNILNFLSVILPNILANRPKYSTSLDVYEDFLKILTPANQALLLSLWLCIRREAEVVSGMALFLGSLSGNIEIDPSHGT